jgi:hypothetical protein
VPHLCLAFLLAAPLAHAQTGPQSEQKAETQKPASLSGVVTNSVTGEPLAHAQVHLYSPGQQGSRYGATTTVDGRFSIHGIVPGQYQLSVERRGYGPLAGQERNSQPLELKAGDQIADRVLRLVPDAVISGRVVDANGAPMEQVDVEVTGVNRHTVMTDDRGEFRISGLRAGRYLVKAMSYPSLLLPEVRSDGTTEINYGPTYYPSAPSAKSAAPVRAQAGQETGGIEIKLVPAPILYLRGSVSNLPKGVAGTDVTVTLDNGNAPVEFRVQADLTFIAWRVPPGRYLLFAMCYDRSSNQPVSTVPAEVNVTTTNIEGLNLAFSRPIELTGRVLVESGATLTGPEGRPPSVKLQIIGLTRNGQGSQFIGADGSFKMTRVVPARYHVLITDLAETLYIKSVRLDGTDFADGILDLRAAPPQIQLTVVLGADGPEVTGVVRDAKGPVAGVEVALFYGDEYGFDVANTTKTQADGSYVLHGIALGKYRILAYDPKSGGAGRSSDTVALFDSATEKLDISAADKIKVDLNLLP